MPALARIEAEFGSEILDASGRLDRPRLRELVFSDPEKRKKLEAITHPAIREELARKSASAGGPYQIHAIPLLAEGGRAKSYDRVLVVDCPEELQIARLIERDRVDATQARRALAAQASRAQRLAIADDVIENTSTLESLREAIAKLHATYLDFAARRRASK
jgi:dephospho-CoA kinase